MKNKLFFLVAGLAIASCAQKVGTEARPQISDEESFALEVSVPALSTKAVSGDNDASVSNWQVFVFRSDGTLEAGAYGPESSKTIKASRGAKTVAVLTNHSKITESLTLATLKAKKVDLSENGISSIIMYGSKSLTLDADMSVEVEVSRLASKIEITSIKNAITLEQYKDKQMVLTGIYLINAAGNREIDGNAAPTVWYNKMKKSDDCAALLCDNLNQVIANGTSFSADRHFYCYPNTSEDSTSSTWSPRSTRLVVELTLGGQTWYYPVTLPAVVANTHYIISGMEITRIGSTDPDKALEFSDLAVTITVKDWVESNLETVII